MQLFFIDESGTIPPKTKLEKSKFFALGGVIIPEDLWHEIDKELLLYKKKYNITGEIKWRYFSPAKSSANAKSNSISHLNFSDKESFRKGIYSLLVKFKSVKLICVIVNVKSAYSLSYVNNENDLYWYAYKQMTERFQYYLQYLSRTVGSKINGIIVCDHRQPKDDHKLRHLHQELLTGLKFHYSKYPNLIEGVFIAPSHLSVGIQFADMVGGAVYRYFVRNDDRYFNLIKSSFRKSESGKIDGYGLVKWPKGSI